VFQAARIVNVTRTGASKSPSPEFRWAEQAEARNPEQVSRVKHAGIDAEQQIAFP
jgi:hypothetical protein